MAPSEIEPLLLPQERVLWSGTPDPAIRFTTQDFFLIPFSLIWGGAAILWEVLVLTTPSPLFFRLWGIPFVVIGLYLIAGRFVFHSWARRNTLYAITDRRVLIARHWPFTKVTEVPLDELDVVDLVEETNGKGTLHFDDSAFVRGRNNQPSYWSPTYEATPQLTGINEPRKVFAVVQEARQVAAAS